MRVWNTLDRKFSPMAGGWRRRRRLALEVQPLEGRQLLSGLPTATMTQTATFPNLESLPNVATQAFLYFSSPMGTLTEVDVVTSGSYSTEFAAENLGSSSSTITGTTSGNVSINLPSGPIPVTIPSVTESFNAAAFDGINADSGTSGKDFAPVTSSAAAQTTVLTSSADLAAYTGNFRIPITVSGHATGSATSTNGDLSDSFTTQTSVTLTIVYHYTPNLPSLNPPADPYSQSSGGQSSGSSTGTSVSSQSASISQSNTVSSAASAAQTAAAQNQQSSSHGKNKVTKVVKTTSHKPPVHHSKSVKLSPKADRGRLKM